MTAFFGSHACVSYQFLMCSYVFESKPVAPDDMYESMTPVASACETSAACTVTGCAPTSSAIFDVAGLYARHFRPFMSLTDASVRFV